jgi:hypothetical protein
MPNEREWGSQASCRIPSAPFYAFVFNPEGGNRLYMTSVGSHSADLELTSSESEDSEWIRPDQQVLRILVEIFKEIPQVKSICAQFADNEITVWTLLETYDRDARERVYGKELEVCRRLGIYDFDFRVSSVDLVHPEELVRAGAYQVYDRQP